MVKNRRGSNPSRSACGEIFYADKVGSQQERFCDTRLSLEKIAAWIRRLTETVKTGNRFPTHGHSDVLLEQNIPCL
jgi:hypothetical protein